MIKRIIFDLDNTIMIWKDNYINALKDTLLYFKVDIKYFDDINNIIENLENKYDRISKDSIQKFLVLWEYVNRNRIQ